MGLADLVLARSDEDDLEDAALVRELAELRRARPAARAGSAGSAGGSASQARLPEAPLPPLAPPEELAAALRPPPKPSLADALLAREEAEDTVDRELEEMERQLQLQVEKLRRQQRRFSRPEAASADAAVAEAEADAAEELAFEAAASPEPGAAEDEELQRLKTSAAKMEEAFPEAEASAGAPAASASARLRGAGEWEAPVPGSTEEEVSEFKNALEHLDVKLRALQSKQALQLQLPAEEIKGSSRGALVEQLQSQNKVLRELLAGAGRKGRLDLDRKLFVLRMEPGNEAARRELEKMEEVLPPPSEVARKQDLPVATVPQDPAEAVRMAQKEAERFRREILAMADKK
ncbi:unnamed protein product, partial [Effrenium voratum]